MTTNHIILFLFLVLSTAQKLNLTVEVPLPFYRLLKYPVEDIPLENGMPWWMSDRASRGMIVTKQNEYSSWEIMGMTEPMGFDEGSTFRLATIALSTKLMNIAARAQELYKKNKVGIRDNWLNPAIHYTLPYCTLKEDSEPMLASELVVLWYLPQLSGNNKYMIEEAWDHAEIPASKLFNYDPHLIVTLPIDKLIPLLKNPAFQKLGGASEPSANGILSRIELLDGRANKFITKAGAKEYLWWLSFYVLRTVSRADVYGKESCSVPDFNGNLRFQLHTKLSALHKYANAQEPINQELPKGEELWELVLKLAFGCPMDVPSCETDAGLPKENRPFLWWPLRSFDADKLPCATSPKEFKVGIHSLKKIVADLPDVDHFGGKQHGPLAEDLLTINGKGALKVAFNDIARLCGPATADLLPETLSRYVQFFKEFVASDGAQLSSAPCRAIDLGNPTPDSDEHTKRFEMTRPPLYKPTVDPCKAPIPVTSSAPPKKGRLIAKGSQEERSSVRLDTALGLAVAGAGIAVVTVGLFFIIYVMRNKPTENEDFYNLEA